MVRERCASDYPALTVPSTDLINSIILNPGQEVFHPNDGETSTMERRWRHVTSRGILRAVVDAGGGFHPLDYVARDLCCLLDYCNVWSPTNMCYPQSLQVFQPMEASWQAIELLAPKVKALSAHLCVPVYEGDSEEQGRRKKLDW